MNYKIFLVSVAAGLMIFGFEKSVMSAVQCSCPTVSAEGEGETSCSAAESSGLCTIDFNLFGEEREGRAASFLSEHAGIDVERPNPFSTTEDGLRFAEENGTLPGVVLLYLVVAASSQAERTENFRLLDRFEEIRNEIFEVPSEIEKAFDVSQLERWRTVPDKELSPDSLRVIERPNMILSPGCVEVSIGEVWVMFKTWWSPARITKRCGGRG